MSYDRLKPETWSHICSFLAPRVPKAMSGLTKEEYAYIDDGQDEHTEHLQHLSHEASPGMITRKDIRATDLAVLMRTSIPFNHAASYHLYRHVIVDDLRRFVQQLSRGPAHPQVRSKAEHLANIRSINLEYRWKGADPGYVAIMDDPRNWDVNGSGLPFTTALNQAANQASYELFDASSSLALLLGGNGLNPVKRFPKLSRLAICAIFGGHDTLWEGLAKAGKDFDLPLPSGEMGNMTQLIEYCSGMLMHVFRTAPITHYCQRSFAGPFASPLSLDWASPGHPNPSPTAPLFTMHLTPFSDIRAANTGHRTRWLVENGVRTEHTTNELCRNMTIRLYQYHTKLRQARFSRRFNIEIYSSSNRYTSPAIASYNPAASTKVLTCVLDEEASILAEVVRADKKERKKLRLGELEGISLWKSSPESPACEACGWTFEQKGWFGR